MVAGRNQNRLHSGRSSYRSTDPVWSIVLAYHERGRIQHNQDHRPNCAYGVVACAYGVVAAVVAGRSQNCLQSGRSRHRSVPVCHESGRIQHRQDRRLEHVGCVVAGRNQNRLHSGGSSPRHKLWRRVVCHERGRNQHHQNRRLNCVVGSGMVAGRNQNRLRGADPSGSALPKLVCLLCHEPGRNQHHQDHRLKHVGSVVAVARNQCVVAGRNQDRLQSRGSRHRSTVLVCHERRRDRHHQVHRR